MRAVQLTQKITEMEFCLNELSSRLTATTDIDGNKDLINQLRKSLGYITRYCQGVEKKNQELKEQLKHTNKLLSGSFKIEDLPSIVVRVFDVLKQTNEEPSPELIESIVDSLQLSSRGLVENNSAKRKPIHNRGTQHAPRKNYLSEGQGHDVSTPVGSKGNEKGDIIDLESRALKYATNVSDNPAIKDKLLSFNLAESNLNQLSAECAENDPVPESPSEDHEVGKDNWTCEFHKNLICMGQKFVDYGNELYNRDASSNIQIQLDENQKVKSVEFGQNIPSRPNSRLGCQMMNNVFVLSSLGGMPINRIKMIFDLNLGHSVLYNEIHYISHFVLAPIALVSKLLLFQCNDWSIVDETEFPVLDEMRASRKLIKTP